jgi:hypothetical protein
MKEENMRKLITTAVAAGGAIALAIAALLPANAQETGTVTVVHGVPGLTVDVYVNGDLTLEGFAPDTVTDPLELPAGDYEFEVYAAGADPEADQPAITGSATLPAGANASVVAHLTATGDPTLSVFVNDPSEIAAGNARLVVRHTAAAPAVDVLANGEAVITNLANPDEAQADVPAGDYSAVVAATGTTAPVIGPAGLTLEEGTAYLVYAVGSLEDDTLKLLTQTISDLAVQAPTASGEQAETTDHALPDAGGGPTDGSSSGVIAWLAAGLAVLGAVLVGGSKLGLARSRSR